MVEEKARSSFPSLVRDLMSVGVPTYPSGTLLTDLVHDMVEKNLESVVILDEDGNGCGYISQKELVKIYARPARQDLKVDDVMVEVIPQVPADIPLSAATQIMVDQNVRVLYVMHHAGGITYPAGMLTYRHILRAMTAKSAEELGDLGVQAKRQLPIDAFLQRREAARKKNIQG
jgi:predicted transcriptional regulator